MSGQAGISVRACTLVVLASAASGTTASAADYNLSKAAPAPAAASNEALLKKLEAMEERIKFLEGKLEQKEEKDNQKEDQNGNQKQQENTDARVRRD